MLLSDERIDAAARAIAKAEGWDASGVTENFTDLHYNPRVVRWVELAKAALKARPRRVSA